MHVFIHFVLTASLFLKKAYVSQNDLFKCKVKIFKLCSHNLSLCIFTSNHSRWEQSVAATKWWGALLLTVSRLYIYIYTILTLNQRLHHLMRCYVTERRKKLARMLVKWRQTRWVENKLLRYCKYIWDLCLIIPFTLTPVDSFKYIYLLTHLLFTSCMCMLLKKTK